MNRKQRWAPGAGSAHKGSNSGSPSLTQCVPHTVPRRVGGPGTCVRPVRSEDEAGALLRQVAIFLPGSCVTT